MDFVILEAEGLPDIEGGRRVLGVTGEATDKAVAKVMFHHQLHRYGGVSFLAPHLRSIAVACLLRCRDDELSFDVVNAAEGGEGAAICAIRRALAGAAETVFWDGGRQVPAWLLGRALVAETDFSPVNAWALERQLGLNIDEVDRTELTARLGFACDPLPTDEANWKACSQTGFGDLVARCTLNAFATARIYLRHRRVTGVVTAEDYARFLARLDELASADGAASA